jgi:hypothetical protein
MVTGRLSGTLDGRPVHIDATAAGITLKAGSLRSLWKLRRLEAAAPVIRMLKQQAIPLRLSVAGLGSVDLLPVPSLLVRLVAPEFTRLG